MGKIKLINTFCLLILISSCVPTQVAERKMYGQFEQVENRNKKILLSPGQFVFVDPYINDMASYKCCDTITKGEWKKEKNLIVFSTPDLNSSEVDMHIEEEQNALLQDSLVFRISNPIEDYFSHFGVKKNMRDIYYRITIKAKNSNFYGRHSGISYDSNVIKFSKPVGVEIEEFRIRIYPSANYAGRNIGTKNIRTISYKVQNSNSNVFIVQIPKASYEYLTYLRLERDFLKIINQNEIEWDGKIYARIKAE